MTLRHGLVARGLATVLVFGTVMPARAAPEAADRPSKGTELRAALVIDATKLGDGGPSMTDVLDQLEEEVLRARGVQSATSDADPRIVIVVRPLSKDGGVFDNHVAVSIEQNGETWSGATWDFDCSRCSDGHLLNKVGVTLHLAVTRLEDEAETAAASGDPTSEGVAEPAAPDPQTTPSGGEDRERRAKLGPLVWAGGATALVGVVGLAVGLPLALREDRIVGDLNSPTRQGYQTRTPGWTVTTIGGAALVAGGALLTVGLVRWSRDKKQPRKSASVVTPWVGSEHVGLSVQGRF